ncbi:hypothetical protein EB75_09625 [Mycobacterium sp. ST-F2]|uniref:phage major capsid protein n=1 Tax=Mycobacterium sp. ST-F2 TaxID=1490484 RepID=UPI00093FB865|nr:phage major capsid protein [Mycobacterium sp. ST-F2]OKH86038.1 hypothetical protein EB75_09625 [Mycobacterium sp. ST-F2]
MATQTTPTSPAAWRPDITEYLPGDAIPEALILTHAIVAGAIEGDEPAVRVPFVADDGAAAIVAEGANIAESDQGYDEAIVQTVKVAKLTKHSYETLAQPEAARLIIDSLTRSVTRKANAAFLGNASGPTGLLNYAGITDGGVIGDSLDTLIDAIADIETAGGTATNIIAAPDAWASLSKLKDEDTSNRSLIGAGTESATRSLLSVPVTVTPDMTAGKLLVIDRNDIVAAVSKVRVDRSDQAFFSSDSIAVRVIFRLGWDVMHPNRLARLSMPVSGS